MPPQDISSLHDSEAVYGWISILLHWITAVIVVVLWFVGKRILSSPADEIDAARALHVSIAASAWLLVLLRIAWRFCARHPRIRGQSDFIHRVAKLTHYAMLVVVALMLLSGPFLVWADGNAIMLPGGIRIPSPVGKSGPLRELAWQIHENMANLLFVLVVLHIGGALKHLMFHQDDTIVRMIWPGRPATQETEE